MKIFASLSLITCCLFLLSGAVFAIEVTCPDTSQSIVMTVQLEEQANIATLTSAVSFNVTNISANTNASSNVTVSLNNIVLNTGKSLKVAIKADSANFNPPTPGTATWAASDIGYNMPAWTNGTAQVNEPLSSDSFVTIAVSNVNVRTLQTTGLAFTLAANPSVARAGNHTLPIIWKFFSD